MTPTVVHPGKVFALIAIAFAIGAMGLYVANADDAPGAAVIAAPLFAQPQNVPSVAEPTPSPQ